MGEPEGNNFRKSFKQGMNRAQQGSGSLAVNNANLQQVFFAAGGNIVGDQMFHITGMKGVEIKDPVNGNLYWVWLKIQVIGHHCASCGMAPGLWKALSATYAKRGKTVNRMQEQENNSIMVKKY